MAIYTKSCSVLNYIRHFVINSAILIEKQVFNLNNDIGKNLSKKMWFGRG